MTDSETTEQIVRDHLGRMVCQHETPGGAARCPLCRRQVLAMHDPAGAAVNTWRKTHSTGAPMPDWFRKQLAALTEPPAAQPVQDALDLEAEQ